MHRWCALLLLPLLACDAQGPKGDQGDPGTDGTDGADGADGTDGSDGADGSDGVGFETAYTGTVQGAAGAIAGVPIAAMLLDGDGYEVAVIGAGFTDSAGGFTISVADYSETSTQLIFVASAPDGVFQSLGVSTDVTLDPASTAVTEAILMIVGTEGGRFLSDFDTTEVSSLIADAGAALSTAGTDLSDADAVLDQVISDIGRDIADASGGTYTIGEGLFPISSDPLDVVSSAPTSSYQYLTDGDGYQWQFYSYYGYIYGYSDTIYDAYGYFYAGGEIFYDSSAYSSATLEDDAELVLGPAYYNLTGIDWYRKIHVSPNHAFIRYLEVFENTTGADIEVNDAYFYGDLNGYGVSYEYTSSGDGVLDAKDTWFASSNGGYAPVAAAMPGAEITDSGSYGYIYAYWPTITVPANGRATILHWHRVGEDIDDLGKDMDAEFGSDGFPASESYYEGLSLDDLIDHYSPVIEKNLIGEAGAMAPYATIIATNQTTGLSFDGQAMIDGSFSMAVAAASGETVLIEATDGTSDTVTIP